MAIRVGRFFAGKGLRGAISRNILRSAGTAAVLLQVGRIKQAFSVGGHHTRGGTQWAPLSIEYDRRRRKRGRTRVLVDTGRLRNTIFGEAEVVDSAGGPALRLTVFSPVPYARAHQYGTRIMPARPPIEITDSDRGKITRSIREAVRVMVNGR